MSNWEHANEAELEAARDAYTLDDPKHPDYAEAYNDRLPEGPPMELAPIDHRPTSSSSPATPQNACSKCRKPPPSSPSPSGNATPSPSAAANTSALKAGRCSAHCSASTPTSSGHGQSSRLADVDAIVGWEARVEARTIDGRTVGSAEAMCTRHEANWRSRDDYALRSMAQTRATSKALRQPLGFVITLAGFDPTPAEEIPHEPRHTVQGTAPNGPETHPMKPKTSPTTSPTHQRKKIYALRTKLTKAGVFTEAEFGEAVGKEYEAEISGLTRQQSQPPDRTLRKGRA